MSNGTVDLMWAPEYEKATRHRIFNIYFKKIMVWNHLYVLTVDWWKLSCFLPNLIQLVVLTRKPMRINPTYAILAMMSLNHIIGCACVILQTVADGVEPSVGARKDTLIQDVRINSFRVWMFGNIFKKVVTWLQVTLAVTRIIAVIHPDKPKFNSPKLGIQKSILVFLASALIDVVAFFIMTSDGLAPGSKEYYQISITKVIMYDTLTLVIQTIIPALSYPFLFFLPIFCSCIAKKPTTFSRNDFTTRMIVLMLVFSMMVEIPQAIGAVMVVLYKNDYKMYFVGQTFVELLDIFVVFNASVYCWLCFRFTSNYGRTFLDIFRSGETNEVFSQSVSEATPDS